MSTQRCRALGETADRCPGVFAYVLEDRSHGAVHECPLCGVGNRWDAHREEWSVDPDPAGDEWRAEPA